MTRLYKIAGHLMEINSLHRDVHHLCRDYRMEGTPDFTVTVTQADIEAERIRSDTADTPDGALEILAVYRKIADRMLDYDTLLLHGSCVAVDGIGYLFTARSGTGKSTHTRLWRELFGSRAVMVNDDKPLIRVTAAGAIAYGTPWNGKHGLGENISVPLRAVCFLYRDTENHIEQSDKTGAFPLLLQQTYRPSDSIGMTKMLTLLSRLADTVNLYRLGCNMEIEAAEIAYKGMKP